MSTDCVQKPIRNYELRKPTGTTKLVGENDKDEIKKEIDKVSGHLKVQEVIKLKNRNTGKDYTQGFKIIFKTTEMADQVCERGLLLYFSITPD